MNSSASAGRDLPAQPPRAVLFDAYGTLFNVYSVGVAVERLFPGQGEKLGLLWRDKQIEYTHLTSMSGRARSFAACTRAGLRYAAKRLGLPLSAAAEDELMAVYEHLDPFPENLGVLAELKRRGIRAGILSNGDPGMLAAVVANAGFAGLVDPVLSVEGTGRFKTDPATYALGTRALGLRAGRGAVRLEQLLGRDRRHLVRLHDPLDQPLRPAARGARRRAGPDRHRPDRGARLLSRLLKRDRTMTLSLPQGVQVNAPILPGFERILSRPALDLVAGLHRAFEPRRQELLAARAERAKRLDAGERPDFLAETKAIRDGDWKIAPVPKALECRRVEITGPVDAKMVINAFNSGADSYMTDFEDSNSPLWTNQIQGQINIGQAIRRTLTFEQDSGAGTKTYRLNDKIATLQVRPRGWHLDEKHVLIDGQRVAGGIFDFALFMFHNAKEQLARGAGPYFYLPKIESHLEARLWNDIFVATQKELGLPHGTIKATVLIETILAAFEMDEILYELREHSAGLNAGRWDYIFSCIKKFKLDRDFCLADRAKVTMTAPFMRAYALLLLETCHRRGAPGDRRHERADPDQERPGEERDRDGRHHHRQAARRRRRLRRRLGRAPGPGRVGDEGVRRRPRRPAEPVRQAAPRRARERRRPARFPARAADHRGRAAHEHQRRHPLSRRLARRQRLRADPQPDGRRRDRRDQPLAGLAVDPFAQGRARRRPQGDRRSRPPARSRGAGQDQGRAASPASSIAPPRSSRR